MEESAAGSCLLSCPLALCTSYGSEAPGSSLEHLHSYQQCHLLALAGRGEVGGMPKEESWAAERLAGRAFSPFPTPSGHHHPLLIFASLLLPTEALDVIGCHWKHGLGHSQLGNMPRRRQ